MDQDLLVQRRANLARTLTEVKSQQSRRTLQNARSANQHKDSINTTILSQPCIHPSHPAQRARGFSTRIKTLITHTQPHELATAHATISALSAPSHIQVHISSDVILTSENSFRGVSNLQSILALGAE
jgi:hypothetical protein